ncbi:MAG: response regulator [Spirochaetaceae bacterium]
MKRILFIDDDKIILRAFDSMLSNLNYNVTTCNDSVVGLKMALEEDFALIIVDYNMPKLNGIELITKLKVVKKDANVYILTGFLDDGIIKKASNAKVSGIMEKPFNVSKIISIMGYQE